MGGRAAVSFIASGSGMLLCNGGQGRQAKRSGTRRECRGLLWPGVGGALGHVGGWALCCSPAVAHRSPRGLAGSIVDVATEVVVERRA